jgi:PKD repeat protein
MKNDILLPIFLITLLIVLHFNFVSVLGDSQESNNVLLSNIFHITHPPTIDPSSYTDDIIELYEEKKNDDYNQSKRVPIESNNQFYNYIIITHEGLYDSIEESTFIPWKNLIGYNIKIVNITDAEIQDEEGMDLPQKIRNFLRDIYLDWQTKYVLIIGNHSSIPMRYCYPNPSNHYNGSGTPGSGGEFPTDYYYADLSYPDNESWDFDADGYFGEYEEDFPDFQPDVYIGRIPTDDPTRIVYTLDKTVMFEQDTDVWKNSALHAGAFYGFTNEENNGWNATDGARCMNEIEQDLMDGWTISHFSEQEGLEISVYNWSPLNHYAFTNTWREGTFGIVNWGSHASVNRASRKIWDWDDGDGIPESHEMTYSNFIASWSNLDDDYPSIVFAIGCLIGCPEENPNGNLGIDLVTKPSFGSAVAIISSTRIIHCAVNWLEDRGGSESICYEFNRLMINDSKPVGDSLYDGKYYSTTNYGWDIWFEYKNMYIYNLYGDPSLMIEGINTFYADFNFSPVQPIVNDTITFLDDSVDLDGVIVNWTWDFGDGEISYEQNPNHQYEQRDIYSVCLTVEDDQSRIDTICKDLVVLNPGEFYDANQPVYDRGFPIRHAFDGDWGAAQNFTPTLNTLTSSDIWLRKFGNPEFNLSVELHEDHPQGTLIDTLSFTPEEVTSSWDWFHVDFSDVVVDPEQDYFIVIPPAPSGVTTSFGYEWGYAFGDQYPDGAFWFTRDGGGLWRDLPTMYEFTFRTYGYS